MSLILEHENKNNGNKKQEQEKNEFMSSEKKGTRCVKRGAFGLNATGEKKENSTWSVGKKRSCRGLSMKARQPQQRIASKHELPHSSME